MIHQTNEAYIFDIDTEISDFNKLYTEFMNKGVKFNINIMDNFVCLSIFNIEHIMEGVKDARDSNN